MFAFKNKVVVITGGGGGIGREIAIKLCQMGASVIINDIDEPGLTETMEILKGISDQNSCFKADISKNEQVEKFAYFVEKKYGRIDLLINNAGVTIGRLKAVEISQELNEWIFGVNYWGVLYCVNNFLRIIRKNAGAKIVNICSLYSYLSVYDRSAYCASKSALKGYTAALRHELKIQGIEVVSVFPGMVNSSIVHNSRGWKCANEKTSATCLQEKYALSSDNAAKQIVQGLRKNRKRIIIGLDAKFIIYLLKFLPKKGEDWINLWIWKSEEKFRKKLSFVNQ